VIFDSKLAFLDHMNEKLTKPIVCFVLLYKTLIRSHLEYAYGSLYKNRNIEIIEKVQKRAIKLIIFLAFSLPYT